MKILDKYLWKATLYGLIMAWIALVILDVFFAFINESGKTNELYSTTQAIVYLVYTLPGRFYEFFPSAILIGTLLGLGNLAAHSEFIAMRAAGISIKQIVFSVLKLGLVLALLIFALGEWLVPTADLQARNFKAHLKNKNITLVGGAGLWIKDKNSVLHIGKVLADKQLTDISVYVFKDDYSGLASLKQVQSATWNDNTWHLKGVSTSIFNATDITKESADEQDDPTFIDPQILEVATVQPNQLSAKELNRIIQHQKDNQINTKRYELIYWKRFSIPLSSLIMLILAMPFLFGSNRGGGAGQRIFIGIVVGITFYLANRMINELGIVYGISPVLSAFLPSLVFLGIGLFALNRIR